MIGRILAAFVAGALFSVGLAVAGMTLPSKVIGFLDVFGDWDPSLALVMASAVGVNAGLSRFVLKRPAPVLAPQFLIPMRRDIDVPLVLGAVLFGVGWGLGGYCPGPVIVGLSSPRSGTLLFVAAMVAGMFLHRLYNHHQSRRAASRASGSPHQPASGGASP